MNIGHEIQTIIESLYLILDFLNLQKRNREQIKVLPMSDSNYNKAKTPAVLPGTVDSQQNNAEFKATNNLIQEDKEMPKIPYLHIYNRSNGYFQAKYYGFGKQKCWTGKNKSVVLKKATEYIKTMKAQFGTDKAVKFNDFCELWLNTVKKPFISEVYYKTLLSAYDHHIKNRFWGFPIKRLTPIVLQKYFLCLYEKSSRICETVKIIINGVLEYAVGNGIIVANPMRAVIVEQHERISGRALTYEELEKFKQDIELRKVYKLAYLIFLYTGVRRSEFPTIVFDFSSGFITVQNSKLKKHQKRDKNNLHRRVPILNPLTQLKTEIEAEKWRKVYIDELAKDFPKLIPGGRLSWLRHTFQTYCRKFAPETMVNLWSGHVLGRSTTDRIYLHIPDKDQLEIAKRIEY